MLAKIVIAPRSAIAANDIDFAVEMSQFGQQIMQQVEFPDIIVLFVTGAVITKKMIQRRHTFRKILIAYPVNDIQVFSCMEVIEAKPIGVRICGYCCICCPRSRKERECQRGNEADNQGFL